MKIKFTLLAIVLVSFRYLPAQDTTQFSKEGIISAGYGYSSAIEKSKGGSNNFVQLSYQFSGKFSLATEFEHMNYNLSGLYPDLPQNLNTQKIFDNYFSLLIKYHLPLNSKIHATISSGWTFYTRQNQYYELYMNGASQGFTYRISSFSDFGIPFLLETSLPVKKNLGVGIRANTT